MKVVAGGQDDYQQGKIVDRLNSGASEPSEHLDAGWLVIAHPKGLKDCPTASQDDVLSIIKSHTHH